MDVAKTMISTWRSVTPPKPHQTAAKAWRRGGGSDGRIHPTALIEAGLGTGKTLIGIEEILELIPHRPAAQTLVLARNANLLTVWGEQIPQHAPGLRYEILNGTRADRAERLARDPGLLPKVWVHSHEDLPAFGPILAQYEWDFIIIDECARFRTASAARTKLLTNHNRPRLDADFKLALSGLPMIKNVTDLYPILRWLGVFQVQRPDGSWKLGNKAEFVDRFLVVDGYGAEIAVKDPAGLAALLDSCRYQVPKSAVINIPRSWRYDRLKMPAWQRKSYDLIRKELKVRFMDPNTGQLIEGSIASRLTELLRLCQVTAGFEAVDSEQWLWHDDNVKTRWLLDVVMPELDGQKAIVWTAFKVECQKVCDMLNAAGYRAVSFYGGGGKHDLQNQAAYDTWKAGKADVFVSTLAKGSAGLNLPEASAMVYHSQIPDTEAVVQSRERNARLTTTHGHLSVIVLEAEDTFDQRISEILGDDLRKAATFTSIELRDVLGS